MTLHHITSVATLSINGYSVLNVFITIFFYSTIGGDSYKGPLIKCVETKLEAFSFFFFLFFIGFYCESPFLGVYSSYE